MKINELQLEFLLNDLESLIYASDELPENTHGTVMFDVYQSIFSIVENSDLEQEKKEEIKERFKKYNEDRDEE